MTLSAYRLCPENTTFCANEQPFVVSDPGRMSDTSKVKIESNYHKDG